MSKLYFCDAVARALPKSRVRELMREMEALPDEARLMLERFCDGKSAEIIHDEWLAKDKQRVMCEWLSHKIESFMWANPSWFRSDIKGIIREWVKIERC